MSSNPIGISKPISGWSALACWISAMGVALALAAFTFDVALTQVRVLLLLLVALVASLWLGSILLRLWRASGDQPIPKSAWECFDLLALILGMSVVGPVIFGKAEPGLLVLVGTVAVIVAAGIRHRH